jgi:hypothetical protein
MRTPEQIIIEIKTFISSSKLFRFTNSEKTILNLLNELENTLNPQPIVEEPVVAEGMEEIIVETIINNPIEFTEPTEEDIKSFNEAVASFLEIEPTEEPAVIEKPIVAKKSTKKK